MTCHSCRIECKRKGRDRKGNQRYQCRQCRKTFTEPARSTWTACICRSRRPKWFSGSCSKATAFRASSASPEVHHATILKLLVLAGEKCERIMAREDPQRGQVRDVECDEVWSFIGKKQKRVRPEDDQNLRRLLHLRCNRAPHQAGAQHRDGQARPGHHGYFH